ncbi:MAG: hypothetical protein WC264_00495 [Candidatus Paceibacterota bacterium]|jgi:hypothetical protein
MEKKLGLDYLVCIFCKKNIYRPKSIIFPIDMVEKYRRDEVKQTEVLQALADHLEKCKKAKEYDRIAEKKFNKKRSKN